MSAKPPRGFIFVNAEMWLAFHREWREIDRRFPAFSDAPDGMDIAEHWENVARMRVVARLELRQAIASAVAQGFQGTYPIAV